MNKFFLSFKTKYYISLLVAFILCTSLLTIPVSAHPVLDSILNKRVPATIDTVLELPSGTKDVLVRGQLVYFATPHDDEVESPVTSLDLNVENMEALYGNPVIQTELNGKTYSLFIDGLAPVSSEVGDILDVTGTFVIKNGFPMLTDITNIEQLSDHDMPAVDTFTIAQIKETGLDMLSRYVKIEDVTLGEYEEFGLTKVSDKTGEISLYKTSPYPSDIKAGDVVDLYAVIGCSNSDIFLYAGTREANTSNIFDKPHEITPPLLLERDHIPEVSELGFYTLVVIAKDTQGIKDVSITYQIGDQFPITESMEVLPIPFDQNKYQYAFPTEMITENTSQITYKVTATNLSKLKTSLNGTISVNHEPTIIGLYPAPGESVFHLNFMPSASCYNFGKFPTCTLKLVKDGFPLFDGPIDVDSNAYDTFKTCLGSYNSQNLVYPPGEYTATITFKRPEDGKTLSKTWTFSLFKYNWDE